MSIVVGVSDMKVSNQTEAILITYSLGSCIGVAIYDADVRVGGLLHFMLPDSSLDREKAKRNPFMFADTGISCLFQSALQLGAMLERTRVVVVGGAEVLEQKGFLNIGKRNQMAVEENLLKYEVAVDYEDVGGTLNRTVQLEMINGQTSVKVSGQDFKRI